MTAPADAATKDAYESAIRSFTEAEVALREIIAAVGRYRAAADLLADGGEALVGSNEAFKVTAGSLEATATSLEGLAGSLAKATGVIAALEPDRFWEAFAKLEADVRAETGRTLEAVQSSEAAITAAVSTAASGIRASVTEAGAAQSAAASQATGELAGRIDGAVRELSARVNTRADMARDQSAAAEARIAQQQQASLEVLEQWFAQNHRLASSARAWASAAAGLGLLAVVLLIGVIVLLAR